MKAEELMVGDWVMPLKKKLKGIPGKIVTIDGGTDVCWIDSKDYSCLILCSDIERIPITPEILEKNGFRDIDKGENCDGFDIYWRNGNDGYSINMQDLHLHYVHELQHALLLCGIDKEIEL